VNSVVRWERQKSTVNSSQAVTEMRTVAWSVKRFITKTHFVHFNSPITKLAEKHKILPYRFAPVINGLKVFITMKKVLQYSNISSQMQFLWTESTV